jgi:hypothetical protein
MDKIWQEVLSKGRFPSSVWSGYDIYDGLLHQFFLSSLINCSRIRQKRYSPQRTQRAQREERKKDFISVFLCALCG